MKNSKILLGLFVTVHLSLMAQQKEAVMLIQPYLQDATPNTIIIKWETSNGEESIVEWGTTKKLGKKALGKSEAMNFGDARLHEVQLTGLDRFTEYFYRVRTGKAVSDIHRFKTPPFAEDRESFNLMAMSDMQYDGQFPNKFAEVVEDGVLEYMADTYGGNLPHDLAMVLIPGDLVENGTKYGQWRDHFFKPAEKLFAEVPVYPVLGNHEKNALFYFQYFSLPQNGTPAYAEHWWYTDYGNTRVIGLNSNDGYADSKEQFDWLAQLLTETAQDERIDFVFAQLHHPYKSELWIPGERPSTGKVVKMLEQFSTETGKPSIHFYGHTHGYSRGQSQDHAHLWVNVASAGGAIDNWGEFEGRDYAEFTRSDDDYGFVVVEVDAHKDDPKFTLKRISMGNETKARQNEVTDSVVVWKKSRKPNTPKPLAPMNETVDFKIPLLKAASFESNYPNALHGASHWQVSETADFEKPVWESLKQHENWYFAQDLQKNDDLTDEPTQRLQPDTSFFWRVRYRDQNLNWSSWSSTATFKTKAQ